MHGMTEQARRLLIVEDEILIALRQISFAFAHKRLEFVKVRGAHDIILIQIGEDPNLITLALSQDRIYIPLCQVFLL